jgi:quercetin dioxygenase-like cupin family protein
MLSFNVPRAVESQGIAYTPILTYKDHRSPHGVYQASVRKGFVGSIERHPYEERIIAETRLLLVVDRKAYPLVAGTEATIPAGIPHEIRTADAQSSAHYIAVLTPDHDDPSLAGAAS